MGSRKGSAQRKRVAEFKAGLGGLDDLFGSEQRRNEGMDERKKAVRREKACSSKQRYATRNDALEAIDKCAEHGTTGLHCYRCPYCRGWHLTSHP